MNLDLDQSRGRDLRPAVHITTATARRSQHHAKVSRSGRGVEPSATEPCPLTPRLKVHFTHRLSYLGLSTHSRTPYKPFPDQQIHEHVPNAAIIPVLSFITSHVLDYDPESFNSSNAVSWNKAKKAVSIVVSIQDFESLLNPYPVLVGLPGRKLRRRNPSFGRMSFDHVLEVGEHDDWDPEGVEALASVAYGGLLTSAEPSSLSVSTDDVELLLEFQIEQMQKHGNRVPAEVQHKFRDLLKDSVVVPSTAHYLSFLDAWRSGDYPTSFDYLHRYFDYTMQNRDRLYYQYALMNLAVLQADFGCHKDAITTMLETVSTARENRDMTCLNFSLNWLFHYGQAHPNLIRDLETDSVLGAGKESLAYLRVKAKETDMGTLWSSVLISEAKLGLMNGESVATSLELLVRSSHLIVEKNMKNMFGAQLSMKMALLDRIGLAHLSNMESEMFLRCHARQSVFDDELKVTCRLAVQLAERGKYDDALKKLEALDENALRSWKPSQYWFKYRGIIKLTRDLRHNNLDGAEQILSQLLQSKMDDMEPDIAFMIDYLHIDCLKRRGDLSSAFEKVEDMLEELQEENRDLSLRLQLMLVKAHLYDKAGRPQRGFTLAMRAASMAWRARLVPNLWHAIGAIANILTSLGEFQAAIDLLTAILPRSLECDSARLSGTLYSHLADATMGLAGSAPSGSARRTECMTRALRAVEKAFDCYSSVEEIVKQCEMMAKKATIMRVAGDKALAADCAATYVALRKHAAVLAM
ncbi:Anaphase-promoting complex subunit 5 like protein [Verticillium longisporum]|nr:Anaphase-promoting complex subunit 5 like protein [Verticillium longisporum]